LKKILKFQKYLKPWLEEEKWINNKITSLKAKKENICDRSQLHCLESHKIIRLFHTFTAFLDLSILAGN